jgi:hypothetical protein
MIKTPVSYSESVTVFYPYPQIDDADGEFLFEVKDKESAKEIVKRINMHDELVAAVNELIPSFIHDSWTEEDGKRIMYFYELLERCK